MSAPPAPREQGRLLGHETAELALRTAAESGRLHHAWLLTGPAGIGKATLAFRFARWLLAGLPPGNSLAIDIDHPVFRRVAAGTHADLLTIARGYDEKRQRLRGEIVADDVRPIGDFLRRTAAEGGWRVVILDGAEFLNRNASNALLKLLEEPPARAVLLLVSAAPGRLLPTIRSRCRILRLTPLAPKQMEMVLQRVLPAQDITSDAASPGLLASMAHGSPGQALTLAGTGAIALEHVVLDILTGGMSGTRLDQHVDAIQRQEGGFGTFLTLLADAISMRVRQAARDDTVPARMDQDLDCMAVWQQIKRMQDETDQFNLDKRQALVSSLSLLSGR